MQFVFLVHLIRTMDTFGKLLLALIGCLATMPVGLGQPDVRLLSGLSVEAFTGPQIIAAVTDDPDPQTLPRSPFLVVLGIAQDAGYPQAGCRKSCCEGLWTAASSRQMVSSLALIDPVSEKFWFFDATPDFPDQLYLAQQYTVWDNKALPEGIFLTHGHMGHYTGLMHLGREAMGARGIKVYALPRMMAFLKDNGPWSQLAALQNIELQAMQADSPLRLNERLTVTPFTVPHRDEFTETAGFRIQGPERSAVFIPDIDKWGKWGRDITGIIRAVDIALLDGTFYQDGEIPGRNMSEIPHPFIVESMDKFNGMPGEERSRIHFIHLNHTNPALRPDSDAQKLIRQKGFRLAYPQQVIPF